MRIGFHTDAFNSSYWDFEQCLRWAREHDVHWIECGVIDGVSWIHGLGYQPHVALWEDPVLLRKKMDLYEVHFSQLDAAFPLSRPEGFSLGVEYILRTIRWAKLVGCPRIDTTDHKLLPEGMSEKEALDQMRKIYERIVRVAEQYEIVVNIEPHGYFTTKPDFMDQMLSFVDSPFLRLNMDTGNTFIAGEDPVKFLERFIDRVDHVHIKDVTESLMKAARGQLTGIAVSHCSLGQGVNAKNIRDCLILLRDHGYEGVLSIECEGAGGPMIEASLEWLRSTLRELGIEEGR